jgi:hypothetical protein
MSSITVIENQESTGYFEDTNYLSSGSYFANDEIIPRSVSPDYMETVPTDSAMKKCPSLLIQSDRGSSDTFSSVSSSSVATPSIPSTPEIKLVKPIPVKKHSKHLTSFFSGNLINLKMTSTSGRSDETNGGTSPTIDGRRLSVTSHHSSSSANSSASRFSKSLSRMFGSSPFSSKRGSPDSSHSSGSIYQHVPILTEKYGDYIKPERRPTKQMGSTGKKNIASGATAVIRLVRQRKGGRILAVKEFKKRDKSEAERDYQKRMLNEYCISKSASSNIHIVDTLDLVKDEKNRWCVVMEYVSLDYFFTCQFYAKTFCR